jgi:pimeloyl-ACP methyl ester carboxylesterase
LSLIKITLFYKFQSTPPIFLQHITRKLLKKPIFSTKFANYFKTQLKNMPFTNFNQQPLFYTTQGEGFPLVLIHGFCEDASMWADFIQPFLTDYQVITMDLPGFGQSEVQDTHTILNYAEAVKIVLDTLQIQQCVMIGHSMGGYTTLAFAEKYPNYLSGLGLFHSHPFADTEEKKKNRKKTIQFIQKHGNAPFLGQMIPSLFTQHFAKANKNLVDKMIDDATAYPESGIIGGLEAMINRPSRAAVLENIDVPVLLIIGKEDKAIPYISSLEMSYLAKVTDLQIIENIGHMGMFETKEKTQKIVLDFLDFRR